MHKYLAVAALGFGLMACGETTGAPAPELPSESASYVGEVHSVSDLLAESKNGRVVLDLRHTKSGFWVAPGTDYSAVDVICPSEARMNLETWLPELATEFGTDRARLEKGFIMFSSMKRSGEVSQQNAPPCTDPCYLHREPDRTWVCFC